MIPKYTALKRPMRVFSEGKVIGGGIGAKAAPYLPIVEVVPDTPPVVIKKGTFVTLDANGFVIPAQADPGLNVVYSTVDVQYGVLDIDTGSKVSAPKTATAKLVGKPLGIALYDYYLNVPEYKWDYNVQPTVGILTEGLVLLALDAAHAGVSYEPGDLLVLDSAGFPVPVTTGADLSFVVGKLVRVIDATDSELAFTGALEYVATAKGLGLPGVENGGLQDGIDGVTKKGLLIKLGF